MADRVILETTFLVDLERERRAGSRGNASDFLASNGEAGLCVTQITAGEVASGMSTRDKEAWADLLRRFAVLEIDLQVCWTYGRIFQHLRDNGLLIGANDMWIAAIAVSRDLPLVTRNERHFRRVAGLEILGY